MNFEFTTIKVIAWFDFDGTAHPMKFQIKNQDESLLTVKINKIIDRKIDNHAGNKMLQFTCECSDGTDQLKKAILKYELDSKKWFITSLD